KRDFVFSSPVSTPFERNNQVHGKIFRCKGGEQPLRTVILLHGWNAEWTYSVLFPPVARLLLGAHINVAIIELPYHAHRKPRGGPGVVRNFISEDLGCMVEATSQAIADTRALVQWLRDHGSTSIGVWGFSLGAWIAGLVACSERDLDLAVLATPVVNVERVIAELPFCAPIRRSLASNRIPLDRLSLLSHQPLLDRRNLLLLESAHDLFVPAETVEDLWHRWGEPQIWRVPHGHISIWLAPRLLAQVTKWIASVMTGPK
ncbi:MAG: alpha/beta hydrolase family protein, partial [Verrucomicrobiales bacterium]|nr:alpha/beta hydrolase family protein [Verrucomicrobiales bacterium]